MNEPQDQLCLSREAPSTSGGATSPSPVGPNPLESKGERLVCLDVFRGFTLLGMVLVNSHPGEVYPALSHAHWHGWTFTDLIFPFFVFIVGVAIPYSFAKRMARGETRGRLLLQSLRRSVLLFAVGLFLNVYPEFDFAHLRIMGVLQRIAICYMMATVLFVGLRLEVKTMVRLCGAILVLYFVLMKFVPVPGYGAGVLEKEGNWGTYIDLHVMAGHMQSPRFEGKSLLGSFPALVTMLMGLLTGVYLRSALSAHEKIVSLYFYGCLAAGAGAVWSLWFPINQYLLDEFHGAADGRPGAAVPSHLLLCRGRPEEHLVDEAVPDFRGQFAGRLDAIATDDEDDGEVRPVEEGRRRVGEPVGPLERIAGLRHSLRPVLAGGNGHPLSPADIY